MRLGLLPTLPRTHLKMNEKELEVKRAELSLQRQGTRIKDAKSELENGYLKLKAEFDKEYSKLKNAYERELLDYRECEAALENAKEQLAKFS